MSLSIKAAKAIVFLTVEELAKLLNIDMDVIPSLRLARYSFAGHVRYSYTDIVAFLKANRIEPPKSPKRVEFSKRHRHLALVPETDSPKDPDGPKKETDDGPPAPPPAA